MITIIVLDSVVYTLTSGCDTIVDDVRDQCFHNIYFDFLDISVISMIYNMRNIFIDYLLFGTISETMIGQALLPDQLGL